MKFLKYFKLIILITLINIINITYVFAKEITVSAHVSRIIDGDTIEVNYNNTKTIVRFFGIQAPELFSNPIQPYANEAKNFLEKNILNKNITLLYNANYTTDKYNRMLAEVFLNNKSINEMLLENGLAFVYILNNTILTENQAKRWFKAQWLAITNNKNIWSNNNFSLIFPAQSYDYIGNYKIVTGKIINIYKTQNSYWLYMESTGSSGFSILISKKNISNFNTTNIYNLINKNILVSGYIDRYNVKFGPFISLSSPFNLFIIP